MKVLYRFCAAGSTLIAFLGMSYLYAHGDGGLYEDILRAYGIVPFQFPFVDISGSLAAWECARQGVDVVLSDPCDVLHRGYNYSPLWMAVADLPLGVADTTAVGWCLDLLFILSLSLLPPPQCRRELLLVLAATLSTMVVFALERANPDLLLFLLALAAGLLVEGGLAARLLGYTLALLAALLKYYPVMVLITVFRERNAVFMAVVVIAVGVIALFWAQYHADIARGMPNIARGPYNTDLFSAQNLPFMLGEAAGNAAASPLIGRMTAIFLYVVLVGALAGVWQRLSRLSELRAALASLSSLERGLMVIGSAVVVGCFFAGQSIGYRGVFLLLVLPGLLGLSRHATREVRLVTLGTSVIIVLLMWGEGLRLALDRALDQSCATEVLISEFKVQFWLLRELCWWWSVSVMLAVLGNFLRGSPIVRSAASLFGQLPVRLR